MSSPVDFPQDDTEPKLSRTETRAANARDAVKAVVACLSTDFIDPWTGAKVQEWLAQWKHLPQHGGQKEAWGGELIGDISSGVALFAAREYCPETMKWLSHQISKPLEGLYDQFAPKFVRHTDDPEKMAKRIEKWKEYQRNNIANTVLFSSAGVVSNVAVQKYVMKNPSPGWHILSGKVTGASLTAALLVGSHAAMPHFMKDLDEVFSKHVFEPVTSFVERQFGVAAAEKEKSEFYHQHKKHNRLKENDILNSKQR